MRPRLLSILVLGFLCWSPVPPTAHGQAQTLFTEDFESGAAGWSVSGYPDPAQLWHYGPNGECGAITTMAAYNHGGSPDCGYFTGATSHGALLSPVFTFSGVPPYFIRFDHRLEKDSDDMARLNVVHEAGVNYSTLWIDDGNTPGGAVETVTTTLQFSEAFWAGKQARLRFIFTHDGGLDPGFGWMVDNVQVLTCAFQDLGFGKNGVNGTPILEGVGLLEVGSTNTLTLTKCAANAPALLIVGLTAQPMPLIGGTLVPSPDVVLLLTTGPAPPGPSGIDLPFVLPPLPGGFEFYLQYWITDAAATHGYSASNALKGVVAN